MVQFFSKWVTPNQLTLMRILLIPLIYWLMWQDTRIYLILAGFLFALACMTDYWDGVLARYEGKTTTLGKLMDPIADKILVSTVLVLLVYMQRAPVILTAILIAREFAVTGLRAVAMESGLVIEASQGGKLKTMSQMISMGCLIVHYDFLWIPFHDIGTILLWVATAVSLWSGTQYFLGYYHAVGGSVQSKIKGTEQKAEGE